MIRSPRLVRRAVITGAAALFMVTGAMTASASPYPGFPSIPPSSPDPGYSADCPLRRVDQQLVHCDFLTGAGVPAPAWVPSHF
jgi:hypothetical protein